MTPKLDEMLSKDTAQLETFDEASEREAYKALVKSTVRGGGCAGCGGGSGCASCASGSASCSSGNCAGGSCGGTIGDGGIGSGGAL